MEIVVVAIAQEEKKANDMDDGCNACQQRDPSLRLCPRMGTHGWRKDSFQSNEPGIFLIALLPERLALDLEVVFRRS